MTSALSAMMGAARRAPPSAPVSAFARGQVRLLRAEIGAEAARVEAAARGVPPGSAQDARLAFGRRADAAVAAVAASIPVPTLARHRRGAVWRFLRPGARGSICVSAVVLNGSHRPGIAIAPFGLIISNHALCRLVDRAEPGADPVRAVIGAHDALLALRPDEGEKLFALGVFLLPAAGGAFLAKRGNAGADDQPAIGRTWISANQMCEHQARDSAAWQALLTQAQMPPTYSRKECRAQ